MNINRRVVALFCLFVSSYVATSEAASRGGEQFLSDISSVTLPGDTSPGVSAPPPPPAANIPPQVRVINRHTLSLEKLKRENQALRRKLDTLKSSKEKRQPPAESAVSLQEEERLARDNAGLKAKNAALTDNEQVLREQVSSLQVKESDLQRTILLQEKALVLAQQNLSLTHHDSDEHVGEKVRDSQLQDLQKKLKQDQDSWAAEKMALQAKLDALGKENAALSAKNDALGKDGETLRGQMKARDAQLTDSQKAGADAMAALQAKLDALGKENAALSAKNDALGKDGEALREQMKARDAQLTGSQKAGADAMATLQAKLDALGKENAALSAKNDALGKDGEALREQMKARDAQLTGSQKAGADAMATLQAKLDALGKENAALSAKNDALGKDGEALRKQMKARDAQLTGSQKAGADAMAALQAKLDALGKENAALSAKNDALGKDGETLRGQMKARDAQLTDSQKAGADAMAALQAKLDALGKENAALSAKNDALGKDGETLRGQMKARDAQLTDSQKAGADAMAALQAKLDALGKENAALSAKNDALGKDGEALRGQMDTLQQELKDNQNSRSKEATALQAKVDMLTKQNTKIAAGTPEKTIPLDTPHQQHSYTVGVILAEEMLARIKENKAMGLDIDKDIMLAGVQDGSDGHLRMGKDKLKSVSDEMNQAAVATMKKKTDNGKKLLDAAVAGKNILQQQGGVVVVLDKKGSGPYNKGDKVVFDSIEKQVGGKSIVNSYNNNVSYTDNISFMLKEAIENAQKGGQVTLYGFAGNIYTPSSMPEGLKAETPVQITLRLH